MRLGATLFKKCGDGETLYEHQKSVRDDYARGLYGDNPKIQNAFSELSEYEAFKPDPMLNDAVRMSSRLTLATWAELESLTNLYGIELLPFELDLIMEIKAEIRKCQTS